MHLAMLGADYKYGLMPVSAGMSGYVRGGRYLGQDVDTAASNIAEIESAAATVAAAKQSGSLPTWWNEATNLFGQGIDVLGKFLETKRAQAQAQGAQAEAQTASSMLKLLQSGQNPFTGGSLSSAMPLIIGGVVVVGVLAFVISRRRR